jgi:hypothetical protein
MREGGCGRLCRELDLAPRRYLVMCGILPEAVPAIVEQWADAGGVDAGAGGLAGGNAVYGRTWRSIRGWGGRGREWGLSWSAVLDAIRGAGIVLDGVMTHFCAAEVADGGVDEGAGTAAGSRHARR